MRECLFIFFETPKCLFVKLSSIYGAYYIFKSFLIENVSKNQMCEKNQILSLKELYDFKNATIENPNWQKFTYDIIQVLSACFSKICIIERV